MPGVSIYVSCATSVFLPRNSGNGNTNDALIQRYVHNTFPPYISMRKHNGLYLYEILFEDQKVILHLEASYSLPLQYGYRTMSVYRQHNCLVYLYDSKSNADELIKNCEQELETSKEWDTVLALMLITSYSELNENEKLIYERISKFSADNNMLSFHCCIDKDSHKDICDIFETIVKKVKMKALENFAEKELIRENWRKQSYRFGIVKIATKPIVSGMFGYKEENEDEDSIRVLVNKYREIEDDSRGLGRGDCVVYDLKRYMHGRSFHDEISPREDGLILLYSSFHAGLIEDFAKILDKFKKPVVILRLVHYDSWFFGGTPSAVSRFANDRKLLALEMNVKTATTSEIKKVFAHLTGTDEYVSPSRCVIF